MAIAYKSAGTGVATETSAAALSPTCPAVVDAGDILIAHVFWEGTTDAPSTPSNWALLDGPRVIETTIARHWVFGKVADGTEDGAAVAFGSPASVNQRGARIYSFSGRVSGTIAELVPAASFAATSHATDPQMPTVTTTATGALAVALVCQNDNNALAAATGQTGGTWAEPVAEFVAALTPGLVLQLETATPTANPGTISGGSVAATNDPSGVIGFQIRAQGATTVERAAAVAATSTITTAATFFSVLTATAAVSATGAVASAGQVEHVHARSAAVTATGAIATSGLFWSTREAATTVSASMSVTTAGQRDLLRSSAISTAGNIATTATREVSRLAGLTPTADIAAVGQRELHRQAAVAATAAINMTGGIEGGAVTYNRSATIAATGTVTAASEIDGGLGALERSAVVSAVGAVSVAGQRVSHLYSGSVTVGRASVATTVRARASTSMTTPGRPSGVDTGMDDTGEVVVTSA